MRRSRWLREPNPTAPWVRDEFTRFVVDLDAFEVCGVAIGDPLDRLSFLGPTPEPFEYPDRGLIVWAGDAVVDSFGIALTGKGVDLFAAAEQVTPWSGTIIAAGEALRPGELRREQDVERVLGSPYWRDQDEDEVLLFYETVRGEVQVELTLDDRVKALIVSASPLLADPEQRAAYRVTRPWPP